MLFPASCDRPQLCGYPSRLINRRIDRLPGSARSDESGARACGAKTKIRYYHANTEDGTPATVIDDREVEGVLGKSVRSDASEDMGQIVDVIVNATVRSGPPSSISEDFSVSAAGKSPWIGARCAFRPVA